MALALLLMLVTALPVSSAQEGFSPDFSVFLACGASSNVTLLSSGSPPRTFTPDNSALFSSSSSTKLVTNPSSPLPLHAAARAATSAFSYSLAYIDSAAPSVPLVLRLHFFPFTSQSLDLSSSQFNVSVLHKYHLLSSFSPPSAGVVKEFFLPADGSGKFGITFTPITGPAFINAIELFAAPQELLWKRGPTMLGATEKMDADMLQKQALEKLYRLNVGGPIVKEEYDTMWRTWLPDDPYLYPATVSTNRSTPQNINFDPASGYTRMVAPDMVYKTLRMTEPSVSNVTWTFTVDGERNYLVRLHFCAYEDLSSVVGVGLDFNVLVMQDVATAELQPKEQASRGMPTQAFYIDYVTTVPHGANLTVSVSKLSRSHNTEAILNGLEIMKLRTADVNEKGSSDKVKGVVKPVLAAVLVVAVLACIVLCVFFVLRRRRQATQPAPEEESTELPWLPYRPHGDGSIDQSGTAHRADMRLYIPLLEIKAATGDFHGRNVIGIGGFGSVYRGVIKDGTRVAVKRANRASRQGFPEFQTEIVVLSRIRHRHLVSLVGYCHERSEMILVYELMEHGTLRSHLYGSESDAPLLTWKQRIEICIGAARGLHYLHAGHSDNIIHRDVKSTNILLGDGLVAKVADFGLSRIGPSLGQTHVSTAVKGSFGYLDPEYFKTRQLTDKSDVYSFAVVLLEVLCARPVIDQSLPPDEVNLAEWAVLWLRRGRLDKIIDQSIANHASENSLRKFAETAVRCLAEYGVDRPSMGDVVWSLEYCLQLEETRASRETFEDSGTLLPANVVTRLMPSDSESSFLVDGGEDRSMTVTSESHTTSTSTAKVFSQLLSGDGR